MGSWSIPHSYDVKIPEFTTPIQARTAGLNLQQLAGNVAIQKQLQQENQLKIQAQQEDQNDQGIIQDAFLQNKGDYDKTRAAIAPKVRLRNLQAFDADHLKVAQGLLGLHKDQQQQILNNSAIMGNEFLGFKGTPEDQRQAAWEGVKTRLAGAGVDLNAHQIPEQAPDDDTADRLIARSGYAKQAADLALKSSLEQERKDRAAKEKEQAAVQAQRAKEDATQKEREDIAQSYQPVSNQAQHDQWLVDMANAHPDLAPQYANLTTFEGDKTRNAIQRMAMTPAQQATVDNQMRIDDRAQARLDEQAARDRTYQQSIDQRLKEKGVSPARLQQVQSSKDRAILQSKNQLNKELAENAARYQSQQALGRTGTDPAMGAGRAIDVDAPRIAAETAWQNHIGRLQQIQQSFEDQIGTLTNDAVPHNDWAEKLTPPQFDNKGRAITQPGTPPVTPAPTTAPAQASVTATKLATAAKTFPRARLAAFAQANKMTPAVAEAALKQQGYSIQ